MSAEKETKETKVTEVKPVEAPVSKPEDPTKALKKQIKELRTENESLKLEVERQTQFAQSVNQRNQQLTTQINDLCAKFSYLTRFIKTTTDVFHQSILMALKED